MSFPFHAEAAGIHPAFYIQDTAPVTAGVVRIVANAIWIDTHDGFFRWWRRNSGNTDWELWGFIGPIPHRTVSAVDDMVDDDELVYLNPTAGSFNFNLLAIADRSNKRSLRFKNIADPDTSVNTATLVPDGAETINGPAVINPGEYGELSIFDSNNWERTA